MPSDKLRTSPRTQSRRQAGRTKSDKGVVTKKKPARSGGKAKRPWMKDAPTLYWAKVETARQFCAVHLGDVEFRLMVDDLSDGDFTAADRLVALEDVNKRFGVVFGSKYADDRSKLAVDVLRAHSRHLIEKEKEKRRAKREAETRRVRDQKQPYVHRRQSGGTRAA